LKADLKFSEVEASFVDVPDMQEDQILHDAAKVLRGSLHTVAVEYFVDKPSGSKEQHLSNKEDIVSAFLFSKRSWCKMSKNFFNAISCSKSKGTKSIKYSFQ
jgi:hypothetical protein